jgi:hypothetical protein
MLEEEMGLKRQRQEIEETQRGTHCFEKKEEGTL